MSDADGDRSPLSPKTMPRSSGPNRESNVKQIRYLLATRETGLCGLSQVCTNNNAPYNRHGGSVSVIVLLGGVTDPALNLSQPVKYRRGLTASPIIMVRTSLSLLNFGHCTSCQTPLLHPLKLLPPKPFDSHKQAKNKHPQILSPPPCRHP